MVFNLATLPIQTQFPIGGQMGLTNNGAGHLMGLAQHLQTRVFCPSSSTWAWKAPLWGLKRRCVFLSLSHSLLVIEHIRYQVRTLPAFPLSLVLKVHYVLLLTTGYRSCHVSLVPTLVSHLPLTPGPFHTPTHANPTSSIELSSSHSLIHVTHDPPAS